MQIQQYSYIMLGSRVVSPPKQRGHRRRKYSLGLVRGLGDSAWSFGDKEDGGEDGGGGGGEDEGGGGDEDV